MKKLTKLLPVIGVIGYLFLASPSVSAANDPFTCSSDFYQVISGQLKVLNPSNGSYSNIGSAYTNSYNAIGYNTVDNYLYGLGTGAIAAHLLKIGSDGTVTDLGVPSGLPAAGYFNGSFDTSGNLYVVSGTSTVYKIDVGALTATSITTSGSSIVSGFDNAYINNKLYLISNQTMSVIDLGTNAVSNVTVSGLPATGDYGAAWADNAGELFFSNNGTGSIYQISNYTTPSPSATFQVSGSITSANDGASCALAAASPFAPATTTTTTTTSNSSTPSAPDTGYGKPAQHNPLVTFIGIISVIISGTGLYRLFRQSKSRAY